jgi:hypothetical protein
MKRGTFARRVLQGLKAPVTLHTRRAFQAWMQAEGGDVRNNPMNTTLHMPGSSRFNSADVQNYPSPEVGVEAMIRTLKFKGHGYEKIVSALRKNKPATEIVAAIGESDWGTNGKLLSDVLDDIKHGRQPNTLSQLEDRRIAS